MFRILLSSLIALATVAIAHGPPAVAAPPAVNAAKIEQSIQKATAWLRRQQKPDGSWECTMRSNETRAGATSLVILAMLNAGVSADDESLSRGISWLRGQEPEETYSVALQTLVLAMVSPEADRPQLTRNVRWLEETQVNEGIAAGSWSYGPRRGTGDNSNSQFALLALHEAATVGVPVQQEVWLRAQRYWVACANPDGSWGYTVGNRRGSGSMTCAGIASMWITSEHVGTPDARAAEGSVACCGGGSSPRTLERGLAWLGSNFTVTSNPGTRSTNWLYYYLYGLERVGRFTARRFIGEHDWYLEGAEVLTAAQDGFSGSFSSGRIEDPVVATSFGLLFLAKGRRPVIVAKGRHLPEPDWNRHGHDIAHLVAHVESRWKRDYPAGLSWHVVDTPSAGLDDLLQSPVLWLSGRDALQLGPQAAQKLRSYIDEGGFVFAEACCPESDGFDADFRSLIEAAFPEPEYSLQLLPPEHPAWNAEQVVPPGLQRPLLGINYGCRTCLVYVPPTDDLPGGAMPSLSCLWELGGASRNNLPEGILREVDAALAIGANVLAYATNRELKRKDELFSLPERLAEPAADGHDRGRLAIGKLRHGGTCDAAPAALANILRAAARELGARVDESPVMIDPEDPAIYGYHLLFMHGRKRFAFSDAGRRGLGEFLERGGTLVADSVCGAKAFASGFREQIATILPAERLEEIPADDPLFTAEAYGGFDIREVELREPAGGEGQLQARRRRIPPRLEGIRLGDRWAVIFSPYDLSCALEKQNSLECTGYSRDDAERIALNILLYSLHH